MGLEPVRFGLLNTANINEKLLDTRTPSGDPFTFDAVGSRDLAKAQAYAAENGIARAHGSYEDLLADPEIEAVYIALPNALHQEWTVKALRAGKHVLCEKPFSRIPAAVEEAFDVAEQEGLVLMEAAMWRLNPQTQLFKELLPAIGELRSIHATFSFVLDWEPDVRLDKPLGGGALLDIGFYCVSGIRLVAGREPDRVYAAARYGRGGVDERMSGTLRFGDLLATFECGFDGTHRSLAALGSEGDLYTEDPWQSASGIVLLNGQERVVEPVSSYRLELENFAAAVRGTGTPGISRAESLGQARVLDALLRSAELGQPIDL